jgi:hypothetical protein
MTVHLCKLEPRATATEAGQFTEAPEFTAARPSIAAERWSDEGQLYAVVGMAATAILTTKIAEAALIMVAEFIVAAPSSEGEPS